MSKLETEDLVKQLNVNTEQLRLLIKATDVLLDENKRLRESEAAAYRQNSHLEAENERLLAEMGRMRAAARTPEDG